MSVFQVMLSNTQQGQLDIDPTTGVPFVTSVQRTIMVTGPNRIQRQLHDGQTFTDCNYWKQFAYPQTSLDKAFINVLTDDGSIYSSIPEENVAPVVWYPGTAGVVGSATTYTSTNNALDIVNTYGGPATFAQIQNADGSHPVKVRLNGSATAIFTLTANSTQIFNHGDLVITKIEFDNSASGASNVNFVEVILSVQSTPTS